MKTSKLLISSLLAAAAMSATAYAVTTTTTTLDDVTYSGTIWTTNVSATGVSSGDALSSGNRTYTSGDLEYKGNQSVSGNTKFWAYFFSGSENTSLGNTLRLTGATADHTVRTDYSDYVWLGGLITDTSDYTYTIGRAYSDYNGSFFHLKGATSSGVNMKIGSNTTIWGDRGISVDSSGSWVIDAGKTLSLKSVVSTAANVPSTNGVATFAAGTTTTVSGGGTLSFTECANLILNGNLSIGESTALDLSGANVTLASAIQNSGTVTLSGTTVFALDNLTATNGTYSLITGNSVADVSGVSFTRDGSAIKSSRLSVSTTNGYAVTVMNYSDLVWAGTAENSVWNTTAENWSSTTAGGSVAFENRDSVTFGEGTDNNVTIAENIKVGTLTVSAATTLSVADGSAASVSASTLSLGANLTVNSGVTLAVTAFASSITANSTVDYSNLSGTGTLSLGLRNDNGVGFNLSNFEGTIRVERGTGETAASRFQLNTSTLNANARIVVADGNDLVFNDDTNKNVSNSVTFEGSGTIHVNGDNNITSGTNVCTGTLSGNVTSAGTLTKNGDGTLTLSGTSNISALTIIKGTIVYSAGTHTVGSISASGKTLTVNGGSLTISGAAASTIGTLAVNGAVEVGGASNTTITTLSGTGKLTKTGAGTLTLTPANFSLASLKVGAGTVAFGGLSSASFGTSTTIEVSNGGNVDFNLSNKDDKTFSGTLVLKNGGKITKKDGSLVLGDVQLGETSTDTVYLLGDWGKGGTKITGALSGAATVYLANAGNMNTVPNLGNTDVERFTISGRDNSYSGTLIVGKQSASTTSATHKTILIVGSETALKNAKVNLALGDKSAMWLGASSVTISGLEGTANSTVALNSDDSSITASTLRVNQTANTTFAGTLAAGIALLKDGTGTLTLSGDNSANSSGIEIAAGVVEATKAAALGAAANAVRISGGKLKIGNGDTAVRLAQTNIEIVLGAAYAKTDSAADATKAAILGSSTTAKSSLASGAVTITVEAADAVALAAATEQTQKMYQIFDLSTISLDGTTVTFELGESLTNQGYTGYDFDANTGTLILTVPEPSAFGLLAGAGALALVAARRRRRKKA